MKRTILVLTVAVISCISLGSSLAGQPGRSDSAFHFKFGGYFPEGGGEFWRDTEEVFFLDESDFQDPVLGFTYVSGINNHLEVGLNLDIYDTTVATEYREYVDEFGYGIIHDTNLSMLPVSVDLRFIPAGRFGGSGRYAAKRPAFYLGGGLGMNIFEYEEIGDFVFFDAGDPYVDFDRFRDSGVSFSTHALAGVELPLGPNWGLLLEGKYTWTDEELGSDFSNMGKIELGGFTAYVGAAMHF